MRKCSSLWVNRGGMDLAGGVKKFKFDFEINIGDF